MLGIGLGVLAIQQGSGLVSDASGLPPGAIAFADFKNGTYYYGGNQFSDFLTENTDWGSFDPALSASPAIGLCRIVGNPRPVIAGALAAAMLADGFTLVLTVFVEDATNFSIDLFDTPALNTDLQFNFDATGGGNTGIFDDDASFYADPPTAGMHKLAITYDAGHLAMCIDGGTVLTHEMAVAPSDIDSIGLAPPSITSKLVAYPAKADGEIAALCDFDPSVAPVNTVAPAISGTAQVGQTLTCSAGTWSNAISTHFQWFHGDGSQFDADATYVCQAGDVSHQLLCAVLAENADGYSYIGVISDVVAA